jgi:hypothetical protein
MQTATVKNKLIGIDFAKAHERLNFDVWEKCKVQKLIEDLYTHMHALEKRAQSFNKSLKIASRRF